MSNHQIEFIVAGIVPEGSGRLSVIGRNGDRPIPLDQTFDTLVRRRRDRQIIVPGSDSMIDEERSVQVRVVSIHAYERSLPVLGEGMTGSLLLEGEGVRCIAPGCVLIDTGETTSSSKAVPQTTTP